MSFILKHDGTCSGDLNIDGSLKLEETGVGNDKITIIAPSDITQAGGYTLTLPQNDGNSGQYLQTSGGGVLSWATVSGGGGGGSDTSFGTELSNDYVTNTSDSVTDNDYSFFPSSIVWSTELSLFVALATSGTNKVLTSSNGVNWTASNDAQNNVWESVTWTGTRFVAVSSDGTNRVMRSVDGTIWETKDASQANEWRSVTWSGADSMLVAVAFTGTNRVMTSINDGDTWSNVSAPAQKWASVVYAPEIPLYVAVGQESTNNVMTSVTGTSSWVTRTTGFGVQWRCLAWSGDLSLFVSLGLSSDKYMTSSNGTTWITGSMPESNSWYDIKWVSKFSLFVAVGGSKYALSSNGTSWIMYDIGPEQHTSLEWSDDVNKLVIPVRNTKNFKTFGTVLTSEASMQVSKLILTNGSNNLKLSPPNSFTDYSLTFPDSVGTYGKYLSTLGNGSLSWFNFSNKQMDYTINPDYELINSTSDYNRSYSFFSNIVWSSELSKFVTVSISSTALERVTTSSDGITWETQNATYASTWNSVEWSPELGVFVAVSSNATVKSMRSSDGITWETGTPGDTPLDGSNWYNIKWSPELGLFVAIGNNVISYSSDGGNWSPIISQTNSWHGITWSSELGLFVAVSANGTSNRAMISSDGINWETKTTEDSNWSSVAWSPELGLFVAVAYSGTNRTMYSSNGSDWTATNNISTRSWYNIIWAKELSLFIAVSTTSSNRMSISENGIDWTEIEFSTPENFYSVAYSDKLKILACPNTGDNGRFTIFKTQLLTKSSISSQSIKLTNSSSLFSTSFISSPELTENLSFTLPKTYGNFNDSLTRNKSGEIVWKNVDQFDYSLTSYFSKNTYTTNSKNFNDNCLVWAPSLNKFVGIANSGTNRVITSTDGYIWTDIDEVTSNIETNSWSSLIWIEEQNRFVAVSSSSTNQVSVSVDGINWVSKTPFSVSAWSDLAWSPELGVIIAVSTSGADNAMISSDYGESWQATNTGASRSWSGIVWSSELGLFVAVGNGYTMYSYNGTSWSQITKTNSWNSVTWSPELGLFAATCTSGSNRIITSSNGITWNDINVSYNHMSQIIWIKEIGRFFINCYSSSFNHIVSKDGENWTEIVSGQGNGNVISWSPELRKLVRVLNGNKVETYKTILSENSDINIDSIKLNNNSGYSVTLKSSDSSTQDYSLTLPSSEPLTNQYLKSVNSTDFTWEDIEYKSDATFNSLLKFETLKDNFIAGGSLGFGSPNCGTYSPELNLFVLVASSGPNRVFISKDAESWTPVSQDAPNDIQNNAWQSVTWSPELSLFVAVSSSSSTAEAIMTSPDGTTWTFVNSLGTASQNWEDVKWIPEISKFVAVSSTGTDRVMVSTDGAIWSKYYVGSSSFTSIAYSPSLDMIILCASNSSTIYYSVDQGSNWLTDNSSYSNCYSVTWSPKLSMFVRTHHTIGYITYSYNGFDWIQVTGLGSNAWRKIIWADSLELLIAVSYTGSDTHRLMYSSNAVDWSYFDIGERLTYSLFWGNGKLLIPVTNTSLTMSIDSVLKNKYNVRVKNLELSYGSENANVVSLEIPSDISSSYKLVFPSSAGTEDQVLSNNGQGVLSWKNRNTFDVQSATSSLDIDENYKSTFVTGENLSISSFPRVSTWSPELNKFVTVCSSGTDRILLSSDGINWSRHTSPEENSWSCVKWISELKIFVAMSISGTNQVMYSSNGTTWETASLPEAIVVYSLEWSPELGIMVAAGNGDKGLYSYNGIEWFTSTATDIGQWNDIAWSPEVGKFVAVKYDTVNTNVVMTSINGTTWQTVTSVTGQQWKSVAWSPELGLFVAVSFSTSNSFYMTSPDGVVWTNSSFDVDENWGHIEWISDISAFVVTAYSGNAGGERVLVSSDAVTWTSYSVRSRSLVGTVWSPELKRLILGFDSGGDEIVYVDYADIYSTDNVTNFNSLKIDNTYIHGGKSTKELNVYLPSSNDSGILNSFGEYGSMFYAEESVIKNLKFLDSYDINDPDVGISSLNPIIYAESVDKILMTSNVGTNRFLISSDKGLSWTSYLIEANTWRSLAWSPEHGIAVAVSSSGTNRVVVYTDSGTTFAPVSVTNAYNWTDVVWSPKLSMFVAVSYTANTSPIMYSTEVDGTNWQDVTLNYTNSLASIAWSEELGMFVAVSNSASYGILISYDGINWSRIDTYKASYSLIKWVSDIGLFIALASDRIVLSRNGLSWTEILHTGTPLTSSYNNLVFSPVLKSLIFARNSGIPKFVLTRDLKTFTEFNEINFTSYNLLWLDNKLLTVGSNEHTYIFDLGTDIANLNSNTITLNDPTGDNKVTLSVPELTSDYNFTFPTTSGLFTNVLTGDSQGNLTWGTDKDIFTVDKNNYDAITDFPDNVQSTQHGKPLQWVPELSKFVALTITGTNRALTSLDGVTWNSFVTPEQSSYNSFAVNPTGPVLLGVSNNATNKIISSADGESWVTKPVLANSWYDITWSPKLGIFAAISNEGVSAISNNNGDTWTTNTVSTGSSWRNIEWSEELGIFIILGSGTSCNYSLDGLNWSNSPISPSSTYYDIKWIPEIRKFIACSSSGVVVMSENGTSWVEKVDLPYQLYSIMFIVKYKIIVISGQSGRYFVSRDLGENWDTVVSSKSYHFYASAYNPNNFVICSTTNTSISASNLSRIDNFSVEMKTLSLDNNSGYSVTLKSSDSSTQDYSLTLPSSEPLTNQYLKSVNSTDFTWEDIEYKSDATFNSLLKFETLKDNFIAGGSLGFGSPNCGTYSPELNLFVLVASSGPNRVFISKDAESWTPVSQDAPNDIQNNAWQSVTWSPELSLFVAVSSSSSTAEAIMTSPDGTTWTFVNSLGTASQNWEDVKWIPEISKFVAVSSTGTDRVMVSTDGAIWSKYYVGSSSFTSIAYSPSLDMIILCASNSSTIYYSVDQGSNWLTDNSSYSNCYSVTWSPKLSMFVRTHHTVGYITYSYNGFDWIQVTGLGSNAWRKIIWADSLELLIAVSYTGSDTHRLMYSSNAVDWSYFNIGERLTYSLFWGNGKLLIPVTNTSLTMSIDSVLKNKYNVRVKNLELSYGSENANVVSLEIPSDISSSYKLVFPSSSGTEDQVLSNNGQGVLSWKNRNTFDVQSATSSLDIDENYKSTFVTGEILLINSYPRVSTWSPELNKFVTVCSSGTDRILVSSDGINWSRHTSPEENSWSCVKWISELKIFVAMSISGTNQVMYSSNGTTWETASLPEAISVYSLEWSPELGIIVAVGNGNTGLYSYNGIEWFTSTTTDTGSWNDIAWSPEVGKFVAVKYDTVNTNVVMTSINGTTWQTVTSITGQQWKSVAWSPELGLFVAVSYSISSSFYMTSPDGVVWTNSSFDVDENWGHIEWISDISAFVVTAYSGNAGGERVLVSSDAVTWTSYSVGSRSLVGTVWSPELKRLILGFDSGGDEIVYVDYADRYSTDNVTNFNSLKIDNTYIHGGKSTKELNVYLPSSNDSGILNSFGEYGSMFYAEESVIKNLKFLDSYDINDPDVGISSLNPIIYAESVDKILMTSNVGTNRFLISSDKGLSWTSYLIETNIWRSLAWSPEHGIAVAVSSSGTNRVVVYTDSGTTFAPVSVTNAYNWTDVVWSPKLSMFVAVSSTANNSPIMYSTEVDGTNWQDVTLNYTNSLASIAWSEELGMFVAVSNSVSYGILISYDGINWYRIDTYKAAYSLIKWVSDIGLFIALASDRIVLSRNGLSWTEIMYTGTPLSSSYNNFVFSPVLKSLIFARNSGIPKFVLTRDLKTFTEFNEVNFASYNLLWLDNKLITIGSNAHTYMFDLGTDIANLNSNTITLNDPTGDNKVTLSVPELTSDYNFTFPTKMVKTNSFLTQNNQNILELTYRNVSAPTLSKSKHSFFADSELNGLTMYPRGNTYSEKLDKFVVVTSTGTGNRAWTSQDGTKWYSQTTPVDLNWVCVDWSSDLDLFVSLANNGTANRIMTSPEGITWTSRDSTNADYSWIDIRWLNTAGIFLAISTNGRFMTSQDGINWQTRSLLSSGWEKIAYSPENDKAIIISNSGSGTTIGRNSSSTYTSFQYVSPPSYKAWNSVTWCNSLDKFVAVGYSGSNDNIMVSTTNVGDSWVTKTSPITASLYSVEWSEELEICIAVSSNGNILYSYNLDDWYYIDESSYISGGFHDMNWISKKGYFFGINTGDAILKIYSDVNMYCNANIEGTVFSNSIALNNNSHIYDVSLNSSQNQTMDYYITLPPNDASSNQFMLSNGDGTTNWKTLAYNESIDDNYSSYDNSSLIIKRSIWVEEHSSYIGVSSIASDKIYKSSDGITWVTKTAPLSATWESVTYSSSLDKLVIVSSDAASGGRVIVSTTGGESWVQHTSDDDAVPWRHVLWSPVFNNGNGYFCAAGGTSKYMYSSDGETWVTATSQDTNNVVSDLCIGENGYIVGVSSSGTDKAIKTTSGTFWTDNSSAMDGYILESVDYSPGLNTYVAVTNYTLTQTNKIYYSTSGGTTSWLSSSLDPDYEYLELRAVKWIEYAQLFIVVSSHLYGFSYMYSSDGINWYPGKKTGTALNYHPTVNNTLKQLFIPTETSYLIFNTKNNYNQTNNFPRLESTNSYSDEFYYKKQYKVSNAMKIIYRQMMNSWTTVAVPEENNWNEIVWVETKNQFIACSTTGTNRIMKSTNGSEWSIVTQNSVAGLTGNRSIHVQLDQMVMVGDRSGADCISISTDGGNNWSDVTTMENVTSRVWRDITYSEELNLYAIVGYGGLNTNRVLTTTSSTITTGWVTRTTPDIINNWVSVTWSPKLSLFVAVSNTGGTDRVMTSVNGLSWSTVTTPNNNDYQGVAWSPELEIFAACSSTGVNNRIMTSDTGTGNWVSRTTPIDHSWTKIKWIAELGMFVCIATGNNIDDIMTSSNGIDWYTKSTPNGTSDWSSVEWSSELACLAGVGSGSNMKAMHTIL